MSEGDGKIPKPRARSRSKAQRAADAKMVARGQAGDPGPREGGRYDQVQRDIEIYRAHLRGIDDHDLAQTYDLRPGTIRQIIASLRAEGPRITRSNPLEVIDGLVAQIDAGISELAAVAARERGAARVAAVTARIRALFEKGKFLQSVGVLPSEAQVMRVQIDAIGLAERLIDVLEAHNLLTEELEDAIDREFTDALEGTGTEVPLALEAVGDTG